MDTSSVDEVSGDFDVIRLCFSGASVSSFGFIDFDQAELVL